MAEIFADAVAPIVSINFGINPSGSQTGIDDRARWIGWAPVGWTPVAGSPIDGSCSRRSQSERLFPRFGSSKPWL
jgi:hypothetical protein